MTQGARGFTLIELMIAAVVLAILAAIAIPSYRNHVLRTQRTDATAALLRVQGAQEKFFLQQHRYSGDLTAPAPLGLGVGEESERGFYRLRIELGADAASCRLVAEPIAGRGQTDDSRCVRFTLDQNGLRAAQDTEGTERTRDCWR